MAKDGNHCSTPTLTTYTSFPCTSLIPSVDCELPEGIFFVTISLLPIVEALRVAEWILYDLTLWGWLFCPGCSGFYFWLWYCLFFGPMSLFWAAGIPSFLPPCRFLFSSEEWASLTLFPHDSAILTTPFYSKGGRKRKSGGRCYLQSPPLTWAQVPWLSTLGQTAACPAPRALGHGQKMCVLGLELPLTALGV